MNDFAVDTDLLCCGGAIRWAPPLVKEFLVSAEHVAAKWETQIHSIENEKEIDKETFRGIPKDWSRFTVKRTMAAPKDGFTQRLAQYIGVPQYDDLTLDVINRAKKVILDALACQVAFPQLENCCVIVQFGKAMDGTLEASV